MSKKSAWKTTYIPLILLVGLVFVVTYLSQFTSSVPTPEAQSEDAELGPPLIMGTVVRAFNPFDPSAANRLFPGFFELGTENKVGFFVRNARKEPVFLTALRPTCIKCTSASGAAIPSEAFQNYLASVAASSLFSNVSAPDLLSALAWADVRSKLKIQPFEFDNPRVAVAVPPAGPDGSESWSLLEMTFKVSQITSPAATSAFFDVYDQRGSKMQSQPYAFSVTFAGREPFEVSATDFNLGELSEGSPPQVRDLICYSATRSDFPPPIVSAENDPFVTISPAIPLTVDELYALTSAISSRMQFPMQIRSGYRYTISVAATANGKSLDIGQFQKELSIAPALNSGFSLTKTYRATVKGSVIGFLRMEGGNKIDFGVYQGDYGTKKDVRFWTERPNVELEVVPEKSQPAFMKMSLGAPTLEAGRTYWTLNLRIPEKESKGPPWDGHVYLRTKGPNPTNILIPASGHGR